MQQTVHVQCIPQVGTGRSCIRPSGEQLTICEETVPWRSPTYCEATEVSVPRNGFECKQKTSRTSYATCTRTAGMAGRPHTRHWPESATAFDGNNSLIDGAWKWMHFELEINLFCPRGFVRREFWPGRLGLRPSFTARTDAHPLWYIC